MNGLLRSVTAALAAAALLAFGAKGQELSVAPSGRSFQDGDVPSAMDRGLRPSDPPREPGGQFTGRRNNLERAAVPGRVLVKFRDGTGEPVWRAAAAKAGASVTASPVGADFRVLSIGSSRDPEEVALELAGQPEVEYAQPAYRMYPRLQPNDPLYSLQWNLAMLDMPRAWDINPGASASIVVAVLDTGVAYTSGTLTVNARAFSFGVRNFPGLGLIQVPYAAAPDLAGAGRFVSPADFIWNDTRPLDFDGHGTHVAGTIGQLTNNGVGVAGMAFNVRIMPVKVLDSEWDEYFGAPNVGSDETVALGIRYAVDNGARVLNLSVGRTGPFSPVLEAAVRYAVSRGAFLAIAGGNDFLAGSPVEVLAEIANRVQGAVGVGAVGRDFQRATYSSVGAYIEVAAPGGDQQRGGVGAGVLQQTLDSDRVFTFTSGTYGPPAFDSFAYEYFQGTSMATPHVAGLAALLMQQGVTNPAAIEAAIERFATDKGATGRDSEYGYGVINPPATLRGLGIAR